MVTLKMIERKSTLLAPSSLACLSNTPTVNLTLGCAHNCVYCYARGYSIYPGDRKVSLYSNIPEKLEKELLRKKNKPQVVYFSPSSDIFQPIPDVLDVTHKVLEILLSRQIGVAFLTKGTIPNKTLELIKEHAGIVRSQIGLITADDSLRKVFEPDAAPVDVRLDQMKMLVDAGVAVEARMIPIIPGVTDTTQALHDYIKCIAQTGIRNIAVSTLFLRPLIKRNIERHIEDASLLETIFSHYSSERMAVKSPHSSIIPLSISERKTIYQRVRAIAASAGLKVSICGCMNPDIGGTCNITGKWDQSKNELQSSFLN